MEKYELIDKHAHIKLYEHAWNSGYIYRNIYKDASGRYFIKYNNAIHYVYLSKTYDANYGWFLEH